MDNINLSITQKIRTLIVLNGGKGSGFFGHRGRQGEIGGSAKESIPSSSIVLGKKNSRTKIVSDMVARMPAGAVKGIRFISMEDKDRKEDPRMGGLTKTKGVYNFEENTIKIFPNADDPEQVVAHEIGHNVHNQIMKTKQWKKWEKICKRRYGKFKFISGYDSMREDPRETFAEMYREYNATFVRDKGRFHDFLLSDGQDDNDLEQPFFDILDLVGA